MGKKAGFMGFNNMAGKENKAHAEKEKIIKMNMGCLKLEPQALLDAAKNGKELPKIFGCCSNGICCCCSCHISKAKADSDANQKAAKDKYT